MKFSQVSIGANFKYRGQDYTKSGPLVATNDVTGKQQLIVRSASVTLLQNPGPEAALPSASDMLPAAVVEAAFGEFYQACEQLLRESSDAQSEELQASVRNRLEAFRQRFLANLRYQDRHL